MTKIALNELRPNPFRDIKRLPPKPEKVAILKESIKETSFWDNLVCRKAPNGSGGYEIAYGHNRLEALKQLRWTHIDIPVRELDNDTMAKIMARENHEEWGAYAEVDAETARAIVEAFGAGAITLTKGPRVAFPKGGLSTVRIAPGFAVQSITADQPTVEKIYTIQELADFLGWSSNKTEAILKLLAFQEADPLRGKINFVGLTATQAERVIRETNRVVRETDDDKIAASIGKQLANEFRTSNGKIKSPRDVHNTALATTAASARANELMREARVKRHIAKKQAKNTILNLQTQNRQVADFMDACKVWEKALGDAGVAVSKFSPEARQFTIRRLGMIAKAELLLKGRLK